MPLTRRVAFVLSGGASLGATQSGMLQALYERGIRPDLLVGTSAGAINAAFIASRPQTPATATELQWVWRGLKRSQIFPSNPLTAGLGLIGRRDHSVSARPLRQLLSRHLEIDRLEDASVELHLVAADVLSGAEVRMSAGAAIDAIVASAAIPGVFPPVSWESRRLVDGGIVNNTPISHAVELGADRVFVLQAVSTAPLRQSPRGAVATGVAALSRTITRRVQEDVERYSRSVELTLIAAAATGAVMPTDFSRADELIGAGLGCARSTLARPSRAAPLPQAA
jgi:NTE family protein